MAIGLILWGPVQPAEASLVLGGCAFDLQLRSGGVGVVPHQPTWTVDGDGSCLATGHGTTWIPATLDGTLTGALPTSAGCAAGVYFGTLVFDADPAVAEVEADVAVAVMAGPVLAITMVHLPTFGAAGVFVEESTDATTACPTAGNSTTDWIGAVVFEDPELLV